MKTYIVFSDIHGCKKSFEKLKPLIKENSGCIFAGDGVSIAINAKEIAKEFYYVKGNCDCVGESEQVFEVEGVKILLTHGHLYGAKYSNLKLLLRAEEVGAKVVIFGHSHRPLIEEQNGILLINPGTCSAMATKKTFAYLIVNNGKATAVINESLSEE